MARAIERVSAWRSVFPGSRPEALGVLVVRGNRSPSRATAGSWHWTASPSSRPVGPGDLPAQAPALANLGPLLPAERGRGGRVSSVPDKYSLGRTSPSCSTICTGDDLHLVNLRGGTVRLAASSSRCTPT